VFLLLFFNCTPGRCIRINKIKVAEQKLGTFLAYLQELPFKNPVLVVWLVGLFGSKGFVLRLPVKFR